MSLVDDAHSSGCMGLNSTVVSSYSLRHAGQRPFRFSLMWCQQKRQICERLRKLREDGCRLTYSVTTWTRLEIEVGKIHLLETERALHVLLCVKRSANEKKHVVDSQAFVGSMESHDHDGLVKRAELLVLWSTECKRLKAMVLQTQRRSTLKGVAGRESRKGNRTCAKHRNQEPSASLSEQGSNKKRTRHSTGTSNIHRETESKDSHRARPRDVTIRRRQRPSCLAQQPEYARHLRENLSAEVLTSAWQRNQRTRVLEDQRRAKEVFE
jgi:hypothetical protein